MITTGIRSKARVIASNGRTHVTGAATRYSGADVVTTTDGSGRDHNGGALAVNPKREDVYVLANGGRLRTVAYSAT